MGMSSPPAGAAKPCLCVLAVDFAEHAPALFALIPIGAVGALLIFAGADLAISRRLFDRKPSCLWGSPSMARRSALPSDNHAVRFGAVGPGLLDISQMTAHRAFYGQSFHHTYLTAPDNLKILL
jgi:hypothetical protein